MRTRVKICGITSPADGCAAARAGADALGLVFYPASARAISITQAMAIAAELPPFLARVALFLDPAPDLVQAVVAALRPGVLQFHGRESPAFCRAFDVPYIKAVPMGDDIDLNDWTRRYADASGLLLDSHRTGQAGGSGATFDWNLVAADRKMPPLLAAGGLTPDNVGAAVRNMRPYAVDVSSGVESAPGIKDSVLMQAFIEAVYRVDSA